MFLLLFSVIPETSVATTGCYIPQGPCYDLSLDMHVGNKFTWIVDEYLIDGVPNDYGIDSEEPLIINLEIINDFRGLLASDVYKNPTDFFLTNFTVDG